MAKRDVYAFPISNKSTQAQRHTKKGKRDEYLTEELAGDVSVGVKDLEDGNEVEDEDDLVVVESIEHCAMHC